LRGFEMVLARLRASVRPSLLVPGRTEAVLVRNRVSPFFIRSHLLVRFIRLAKR
jgi:hypothetical protein